jgi:hypothetical protein
MWLHSISGRRVAVSGYSSRIIHSRNTAVSPKKKKSRSLWVVDHGCWNPLSRITWPRPTEGARQAWGLAARSNAPSSHGADRFWAATPSTAETLTKCSILGHSSRYRSRPQLRGCTRSLQPDGNDSTSTNSNIWTASKSFGIFRNVILSA